MIDVCKNISDSVNAKVAGMSEIFVRQKLSAVW